MMLKKFQFFDKEEIKNEESLSFKEFHTSCSCAGKGFIYLGDGHGNIKYYNREFYSKTYNAHDLMVSYILHIKKFNILISLGLDKEESNAYSCIKFWRLDRDDNGIPEMFRKLKIFSSDNIEKPITCISVLEDLSEIAIGLGNGGVYLYSGDFLKSDKAPKTSILRKEGDCVTGVHFRDDGDNSSLWVVTTKQVFAYFIKKKHPRYFVQNILDDEQGAELRCSVVNDDKQLVVAHAADIKFYEADDIGPCLGLEEDNKDVVENNSTVTIYDWRDKRNKFIAYQASFKTVTEVVAEWGRLIIFCSDAERKVFRLTEQDLHSKMRVLYNKFLHQIAISLARSQGDEGYVMETYQAYGDHLYKKGDFDGAITQYIETIGFVEPSYVIRNFLDAPRIHNLTRYLQALHSKQIATSDHTTLLLNCYTKLKDVSKLNDFVKTGSGLFDVDTAITVCRQAGYFEHASYLSFLNNRHSEYAKILLEDTKAYHEALLYISSLEFELCEKYVRQYGNVLYQNQPLETLTLLQTLCTSYVPKALVLPVFPNLGAISYSINTPPSGGKAKGEDFLHIFVDESDCIVDFLEFIIQYNQNDNPSIIYDSLIIHFIKNWVNAKSENNIIQQAKLDDKIMNILKQQPYKYDTDNILIACNNQKYEKGIIFLYERLNLYEELLQHLIDLDDREKIMDCCKKHGATKPDLWKLALAYFSDSSKGCCVDEIKQILDKIDALNSGISNDGSFMPPLMVIQTLSKNTQLPLSSIKDYIIKNLSRQQQNIAADRSVIRGYQDSTKKLRAETEELRNCPKTFNAPKCHLCTSAIELPAVHFLCGHSFHQRCLSDNDKECPNCFTEFRKVLDIKDYMRKSVNQHDKFFSQLEQSTDGFNTVAEYYGRCMFAEDGPSES